MTKYIEEKEKLLFKNYNIRKNSKHCVFYEIKDKNIKGEQITIEVTEIYPDNTSKDSLPNLWKKHGYTDKLYYSYLCVDTYVIDKEGSCWAKYNITHKLSDDKKRKVINFENLLEVSENNKIYLLNEIYKKFMEG